MNNATTTAAVAYLSLGGLITFCFGVAYLVRCRTMARMVGIKLPSRQARADYRAMYGGAQIGTGIFFCVAALRPNWLQPGISALTLFAFGFGLIRLASLARERVGRDFQWLVGLLEIGGGMVGVVILVTGR